eukprot:113347-Prorocentrum_minimum.AAC.1
MAALEAKCSDAGSPDGGGGTSKEAAALRKALEGARQQIEELNEENEGLWRRNMDLRRPPGDRVELENAMQDPIRATSQRRAPEPRSSASVCVSKSVHAPRRG